MQYRHPPDEHGFPPPHGLYDPARESDSCGVAAIVDVRGRPSRRIVADALAALRALAHRTAVGREPATGDGAGITLAVPAELYGQVPGLDLPEPGRYATGLCFLPADPSRRRAAQCRVEALAAEERLDVLGWREVPVEPDRAGLGATAERSRPHIAQLFVAAPPADGTRPGGRALDRLVYPLRRRAEKCSAPGGSGGAAAVYFPSLSSRTIVYKGMLTAAQLPIFYPDLGDPRCVSPLALVHGRFSTNTFPSWPLAQPFRVSAHNGEINTIRGNRARMRAREPTLRSPVFPGDPARWLPVCTPGMSDSATVDEVLELLYLAGRDLPHAATMLMPPAWEHDTRLDARRRAFHEYHACLLEPWDGPACLAFTDGRSVGAISDRNGLRPGRWWRTRDGTVIFGSETGVLPVAPDQVVEKGRLEPGRIFVVDTVRGRVVDADELLDDLAGARPYRAWLDARRIHVDPGPPPERVGSEEALRREHVLFGYTEEDLETILTPMAVAGREPLGSMGADVAPAVLSPRPRLLYDYVVEMFAQVTNPPLDATRERIVTSLRHIAGPQAGLLDAAPDACRRIVLSAPVLGGGEFARGCGPFAAATLTAVFAPTGAPGPALAAGLDRLCAAGDAAIDAGAAVVVVTDRAAGAHEVSIPSLLAVSALHRHLVESGRRTRVALVADSGDAREVHHVAALLGFGADAVCPRVAFATVAQLAVAGRLGAVPAATAQGNYRDALVEGVVEVMAKCGISCLSSYIGAGTFDTVGLGPDIVGRHLPDTGARIGGTDLARIATETRDRHRAAVAPAVPVTALPPGGVHRYRRGGEPHVFTPEAVFLLQHAARAGRPDVFARYCAEVDGRARAGGTLRGLLRLREAPAPLGLDEVEPADAILARFATGAMSYGSLSADAHESLAVAMNRLGGRSNSGEGGEDPSRLGDPSRRSAVKQIASGRFGVTAEYLADATDLQIKIAQGAKPGEGGQLPGAKVYPWIARTRHAVPGVGLISPPPHHDIYSIEDLAELIHDLRCVNPAARIHVKLVSGCGVGTVAAGVVKAGADVVLISGHDGGTGAALLTALHHSGLPWEIGLAETQQTLALGGLRDRVTVQCDGGLRTGRDVVIAALLGAEEFGFATAPLVVLGCVLMRVCHLDTCPVGVATQDRDLRARFTGRAEHVERFFRFVADEVRADLARLGLRRLDDAVGRVDLLDTGTALDRFRDRGLDLSPLFVAPIDVDGAPAQRRRTRPLRPPPAGALDARLLAAARDALDRRRAVRVDAVVRNGDRAVGTRLGAAVVARHGRAGLPPDTVLIRLRGSAGQSLGAFLPPGVTVEVVGDANDGVAKGLCGGCLVLRPDPAAPFAAHTQVIAGNTLLYGATSGRLYVRGRVGERFAVRNSGADAVCEGTGDHACEYMTGGRVVILGPTGRNVAAGMSGGVVHVLDLAPGCVNPGSVVTRAVAPADLEQLRILLSRHRDRTGSPVAAAALVHWPRAARRFTSIVPAVAVPASARTDPAEVPGG